MAFEITIATEPVEHQFTDKSGIQWTMRVKPLIARDLGRIKDPQDIGIAADYCVAIIGATAPDGGPVTCNGKPVTDPSLKALLLGSSVELSLAVMDKALSLGQQVVHERGN